jgi:hypothetical protein
MLRPEGRSDIGVFMDRSDFAAQAALDESIGLLAPTDLSSNLPVQYPALLRFNNPAFYRPA